MFLAVRTAGNSWRRGPIFFGSDRIGSSSLALSPSGSFRKARANGRLSRRSKCTCVKDALTSPQCLVAQAFYHRRREQVQLGFRLVRSPPAPHSLRHSHPAAYPPCPSIPLTRLTLIPAR